MEEEIAQFHRNSPTPIALLALLSEDPGTRTC